MLTQSKTTNYTCKHSSLRLVTKQNVRYLQVMTTVFSPSQDGLSDIILACVVISWGDNCGSSLGCVCIHPKGSIS